MPRHTYLRLHKIDRLIRELKYPDIKRIQRELGGYSERTNARDIEALKDSLHAPLKYSKHYNGYYYSDRDFFLPPLNLSKRELTALLIGRARLEETGKVSISRDLRSAVDKLFLLTPYELSVDAVVGAGAFSFRGEGQVVFTNHELILFSKLADALNKKVLVEIRYKSLYNQQTATRVVAPFHLRFAFGGWYLTAYCFKHNEIRNFYIKNISKVSILKQNNTHQELFDPQELFRHSWGVFIGKPQKVRLLFHQSASRYIADRIWHPDQQIKHRPDGQVEFAVTVAGFAEIKRWILGFGSNVKVISPKELQADVKNTANDICCLY